MHQRSWLLPTARSSRNVGFPAPLLLLLPLLPLLAGAACATAEPPPAGKPGAALAAPKLAVRLDVEEAEAALAILERENAGQTVREADWRRLFDSPGYVRLSRREAAYPHPPGEEDFKRLLRDKATRDRAPELRATLSSWRQVPLADAAALAFAYLPPAARIRATVYPVIKPSANSFVFETATDPAIFLYLNPKLSSLQFTNKVAHELHHIGLDSTCPPADVRARWNELPPPVAALHRWLGAFGEGHAMLAAAGGPQAHPIAGSEGREAWDANVAHFDRDLGQQNQLFLDVLDGRLTDLAQIDARMSDDYGAQGPWYTVGWQMDVTIERAFGRARLVAAMCDSDLLLATYDEAAQQLDAGSPTPRALWSADLAARIAPPPR
jgi:hypothetical protein